MAVQVNSKESEQGRMLIMELTRAWVSLLLVFFFWEKDWLGANM